MAKQKKYHWLYRLWIKIRGVAVGVIVLAGLVVGMCSILLPFESLYQARLIAFLEKQWNLAVEVDEVRGSWRGYGPQFRLNGLKLSGKQSVHLEQASVTVNVYQLLTPGGRTGIDLSVNQAELGMIRAAGGAKITINDEPDETRFTEMLDRVLTTGSISVEDMVFNLADDQGGILLAGLTTDLLLQQDEQSRALKMTVENDAQSITIISQGLKTNQLSKDANWYINFDQFELSQLNDLLTDFNFPQGQINGQLWFTAKSGAISSMSGELSWYNQNNDFGFDLWVKQFGDDKNWLSTLLITEIHQGQQKFDDIQIKLQRNNNTTAIKSAAIPFNFLAQFADGLGAEKQNLFPDELAGQIDEWLLRYDHLEDSWHSRLRFSELAASHALYQFNGLAGAFQFDKNSGQLLLDSTNGSLQIPEVFRGTLNWQALTMQNDLDWSRGEFSLTSNNFWCRCEDFELQLWADLAMTEPPELILSSRLSDVDVSALKKYWPHNVWKPQTLAWLDRGLLGGQVSTGLIIMNGQLVPKAFKNRDASFISRAYTDDVSNLFHPEWPLVDEIDAVAVINHESVAVTLDRAITQGIVVSDATIDIASFDAGILNIQLAAGAKDNQLLAYIRRSPLVKNIELSEAIKVGGQQQVELAFDVAIKPEVELPFQPKGTVHFSAGTFATEHLNIDAINGPLMIDGYALTMNDLPAELGDAAISLDGEIITKSDTGFQIDVNMMGRLSADYLLSTVQQDLPIMGESEWQINIKNKLNDLVMTASSLLQGTAIQLPAPLDKSTAEDKLLSISCVIPCQQSTVEINYNDQIKSTLENEAGRFHLAKLQFLDRDKLADLDTAFGGYIAHLNLDQWLNLMAHRAVSENDATDTTEETTVNGTADWPVDELTIQIGELLFMSRAFQNLELNIKRLAERYEINVNGEQMQGLVTIDDDLAQNGIVAEFDYLDWIAPVTDVLEPLNDAGDAKVPDIHLWSKAFQYAGIPLGELRMEMRNVADGIKVEQLSLKSPEAEINVSGQWLKSVDGVGRSSFDIVMISEKIADFLQKVGFSAPITNAQTLIELNAQWDGVPSDFDFARIDGALDIKIGKGQVLDQNPGFGRVLGLFNLTNLPRRLILDFSDVLADGLLFTSMEGHFVIESGVANTDDFLITASAAKIRIKGDVGFADKSYNQTITIRPQIGKTFPTIGAIAGGPVGAAAGFLVQGLFDKQLKKGNEIKYAVTGTWDEPLIELVEDEINE